MTKYCEGYASGYHWNKRVKIFIEILYDKSSSVLIQDCQVVGIVLLEYVWLAILGVVRVGSR